MNIIDRKFFKCTCFSFLLSISLSLFAEPLEFITFQASSQHYPALTVSEQAALLNKGNGTININTAPNTNGVTVNQNVTAGNLASTNALSLGPVKTSGNRGLLRATASNTVGANSLQSSTAHAKSLRVYNQPFPNPGENMRWEETTLSVKNDGTNNSKFNGKFLKIGSTATANACTLTLKSCAQTGSPCKIDTVDDNPISLAFNYSDPNWQNDFKAVFPNSGTYIDVFKNAVSVPVITTPSITYDIDVIDGHASCLNGGAYFSKDVFTTLNGYNSNYFRDSNKCYTAIHELYSYAFSETEFKTVARSAIDPVQQAYPGDFCNYYIAALGPCPANYTGPGTGRLIRVRVEWTWEMQFDYYEITCTSPTCDSAKKTACQNSGGNWNNTTCSCSCPKFKTFNTSTNKCEACTSDPIDVDLCESCTGSWDANTCSCDCGTAIIAGETIYCSFNRRFGCACGNQYRACR